MATCIACAIFPSRPAIWIACIPRTSYSLKRYLRGWEGQLYSYNALGSTPPRPNRSMRRLHYVSFGHQRASRRVGQSVFFLMLSHFEALLLPLKTTRAESVVLRDRLTNLPRSLCLKRWCRRFDQHPPLPLLPQHLNPNPEKYFSAHVFDVSTSVNHTPENENEATHGTRVLELHPPEPARDSPLALFKLLSVSLVVPAAPCCASMCPNYGKEAEEILTWREGLAYLRQMGVGPGQVLGRKGHMPMVKRQQGLHYKELVDGLGGKKRRVCFFFSPCVYSLFIHFEFPKLCCLRCNFCRCCCCCCS